MNQYVTIEEFNSLKTAYLDTVELLANALKRITQLEEALFLQDEEGELIKSPEDKPVISPNFNKAEISNFPDKSLVPPSKNLTEIRADYLADYIIENSRIPKAPAVFANIEVKVMDSNEFRYFVNHILPPEYRPESTKNLRKLKKDVYETAAIRHKSRGISTDKADHGRQELRLLHFREKTLEEMQPLFNAINQPSLSVTA